MNLKIGHRTYLVRRQEPKDRMGTAYGFCDKTKGVLGIDGETVAEEQSNTLIHETLHAIWATQELKNDEVEELVVTHLANGLTQVIRDNPVWVEVVKAGLEGVPIVPSRRPAKRAA